MSGRNRERNVAEDDAVADDGPVRRRRGTVESAEDRDADARDQERDDGDSVGRVQTSQGARVWQSVVAREGPDEAARRLVHTVGGNKEAQEERDHKDRSARLGVGGLHDDREERLPARGRHVSIGAVRRQKGLCAATHSPARAAVRSCVT